MHELLHAWMAAFAAMTVFENVRIILGFGPRIRLAARLLKNGPPDKPEDDIRVSALA